MVERDFHVELYPCRKNYEYLYKQGVERDFNESSSNLHKFKSEVEEEKRLHKKGRHSYGLLAYISGLIILSFLATLESGTVAIILLVGLGAFMGSFLLLSFGALLYALDPDSF